MVSVEGFEPPLPAPKAGALPGYAIRRKTGAVILILTTLPRWTPRQLIPYRIKLGAQCLVRTDDLSLTRRLRYHYANRANNFYLQSNEVFYNDGRYPYSYSYMYLFVNDSLDKVNTHYLMNYY